MSIRAMNWAMEQATGCPWTQCLLYVVADCANPEGICWPSAAWMADKSQQSRATVYRRLAEMREMGLLELFPRYIDGDGKVFYEGALGRRQTSPEIRLIFAALVNLPRKRIRKNTGENDEEVGDGVSLQATGGVSQGSDTPVAVERQGPSHCSDSKKNQNLNQESDERDSRAREPLISREAFALADEYRKAVGAAPDDDRFSGLAYTAQIWITRGYDHCVALATASEIAKHHGHKPLSYHAKAVEQRCEAAKTKPICSPEGRHAAPRPPATEWQASRDNWRRTAQEFGAAVDAIDGPPDPRGQGGS